MIGILEAPEIVLARREELFRWCAGLVDAGVVVGWLHASAAFTKRTRLGPGRLTVTSFEFHAPGVAAHPLAPLVLAAIAAS